MMSDDSEWQLEETATETKARIGAWSVRSASKPVAKAYIGGGEHEHAMQLECSG